jgi:hypothetical protein
LQFVPLVKMLFMTEFATRLNYAFHWGCLVY